MSEQGQYNCGMDSHMGLNYLDFSNVSSSVELLECGQCATFASFLRWSWCYTILKMQKAKIIRVSGWHFSDTSLFMSRILFDYETGSDTDVALFFQAKRYLLSSLSRLWNLSRRRKNTLFSESRSRLSSFTVCHSVILFYSNSIKLIVFLGNYPQPPAGQISIHDLNNAY